MLENGHARLLRSLPPYAARRPPAPARAVPLRRRSPARSSAWAASARAPGSCSSLGRDDHDPLFLQLKEAQASVLGAVPRQERDSRITASGWSPGQRLMQAASDVMLGWLSRSDGIDGVSRDFYVRQLWDGKGSAAVDVMEPSVLTLYGRLCGWTLGTGSRALRETRPLSQATWAATTGSTKPSRASAEQYADQRDDYAALRIGGLHRSGQGRSRALATHSPHGGDGLAAHPHHRFGGRAATTPMGWPRRGVRRLLGRTGAPQLPSRCARGLASRSGRLSKGATSWEMRRHASWRRRCRSSGLRPFSALGARQGQPDGEGARRSRRVSRQS